jgi:hypothetical protein
MNGTIIALAVLFTVTIVIIIIVKNNRSRSEQENTLQSKTSKKEMERLIRALDEERKNTPSQAPSKEYSGIQKDIPKAPNTPPKKYMMGGFDLMGDWNMSLDKFNNVIRSIKEGEEFSLQINVRNEYDAKAIRVLYKGDFIGFVPKAYTKKGELFNRLQNNEQVYVTCGGNRSWYGDQKQKMFFDLYINYEFVDEERLAQIKKQESEYSDGNEKPYTPNLIELKRDNWEKCNQARDLQARGYVDNAIEIFEGVYTGRRSDNTEIASYGLIDIYYKRKQYQKVYEVCNKEIAYWKKKLTEDNKAKVDQLVGKYQKQIDRAKKQEEKDIAKAEKTKS